MADLLGLGVASHDDDQLSANEVFWHGMESGFSGFIYYQETTEMFDKYGEDIWKIYEDYVAPFPSQENRTGILGLPGHWGGDARLAVSNQHLSNPRESRQAVDDPVHQAPAEADQAAGVEEKAAT